MLQLLHNDYDKFMLKWPPFPLQQIMVMSPLLSIVWLIGLGWLLRNRPNALSWRCAYCSTIAHDVVAETRRTYYPAAAYPYLIAAGAVPIERWTGVRRAWRSAIVAVFVAFAVPSTPFVLPILPMSTYVEISRVALGSLFDINFHVEKASNNLPIQYYADMTGWPQMAKTSGLGFIARCRRPSRARTAIYAHNFGEAAAIDLYGAADHLPPALSGNNNYWLWGRTGMPVQVVIDVNGARTAPVLPFRTPRGHVLLSAGDAVRKQFADLDLARSASSRFRRFGRT